MTVMLILMAVAASLFARSLSVRARESRTTDALTSAYAALNLMSREISNGGFGLRDAATRRATNGIVVGDSSQQQIHLRSNFTNVTPYTDPNFGQTSDPGEDVTYFFESGTQSIVRFDPNADPQVSVVVNKISGVRFDYYNYDVAAGMTGPFTTPTSATGRIVLTVRVDLDPVYGQPNPQSITFSSEVNMRNSSYMLQQY